MKRTLAQAFVIVIGFLLVVAEVQRMDEAPNERSQYETQAQ